MCVNVMKLLMNVVVLNRLYVRYIQLIFINKDVFYIYEYMLVFFWEFQNQK